MVDNIKFMMDCVVFMIYVYEYYENRWWCRDLYYDYCEDWLEVQRILVLFLDSWFYEMFVDFDNYLDDIWNDWINLEINKVVLYLCQVGIVVIGFWVFLLC